MKKVICVLCFAVFAFVSNAQDLEGTWQLESVQVVSSSDMQLARRTKLNSTEKFIGNDKLPQQLIFSEQNVSYVIDGSVANTGIYTVKGDELQADLAVAIESYRWKMENGKLELTATFEKADVELKVSSYKLTGYYRKVNE